MSESKPQVVQIKSTIETRIEEMIQLLRCADLAKMRKAFLGCDRHFMDELITRLERSKR